MRYGIRERLARRVRNDAHRIIPARRRPGKRYAILLCGVPSARHLNDLEFCYRMLRQGHGFEAANIFVLNHDGTLNTVDGPAPQVWPGNGSPYTLKVTHPGTVDAFRSVLHDLARPRTGLQEDDLLFIHTNGHGDGIERVAYLETYRGPLYMAPQFARDLATLPRYESLLVMMQQCYSGGFNRLIVEASTAQRTSVASAATDSCDSHAMPGEPEWNAFARAWIAAQMGRDVNGQPLAGRLGSRANPPVDAGAAYRYAAERARTIDTPSFLSSRTGSRITLRHVRPGGRPARVSSL
jgi:hypothetical protein